MCIHHRLIYRKCGHFTWLGITKKCQSERNFDQGKIDKGCNVMWTHPLSTYRVDRCCESCALERATTDRAIDEIRGRIQLTRELLARIQDLREASSGVLERGWSDGGVESAATMNRGSIVKVGVVHDCGGDGDVEEAETMDLIDPNEVIKVSQAAFRDMMEFVREHASRPG